MSIVALALSVIGQATGALVAPQVLQARIDATEAGATLLLAAGRYAAPVTIDHPMHIRAEGHVVLDAGGSGNVLVVTAPDVTLEGLELRGTGDRVDSENSALLATNAPRLVVRNCTFEDVLFGISLKQSSDSRIVGNTIRSKPLEQPRRGDAISLWQSHNVTIEDNVVISARDLVMWYSDEVILRRNRVSHGRYGMHFMYSSRNVLEDNVLVDNSVGAFLMYSRDLTMRRNVIARNNGPSGFGIGLKDMDGLVAEDNLIVDKSHD